MRFWIVTATVLKTLMNAECAEVMALRMEHVIAMAMCWTVVVYVEVMDRPALD
tara:strand:- start:2253 stop:2411 length:159 start_codon:yes stop_codon:yes gene_type:complete